MFSGPVARGFETSAMPLQSPVLRLTHYCLAYHPVYLAYLVILLQVYLICHWMPSWSSSIASGVGPSVLGSQLGCGQLFLVLCICTCHHPWSGAVWRVLLAMSGQSRVGWAGRLNSAVAARRASGCGLRVGSCQSGGGGRPSAASSICFPTVSGFYCE